MIELYIIKVYLKYVYHINSHKRPAQINYSSFEFM